MKDKIMRAPKIVTIITGIVVVAIFLGVTDVMGILLSYANLPALPGYGLSMIAELAAGIVAFLFLLLFGYQGKLKEKGKGFVLGLYIGGFLTGYCCLTLMAQCYVQALDADAKLVSALEIVFFVLTMFLIGWTEELIFRGVVMNLFLERFSKTKRGILASVILSSVLFGAVHLTNISSGVSLASASIQAVTAGLLGVILGAVYVRSGNLWLVIMYHALVDFAGLMGSGLFGGGTPVDQINQMSAANLIMVPILLIPCVILLRPRKLQELEMEANDIVVFETCEEAEKDAFVSLILGAISFMFCFSGYGIGLSIAGVIAGMHARKIGAGQKGVALAGIILSSIGLAVGILAVIGISVLLHSDFFQSSFF